jgi:Fic family protein
MSLDASTRIGKFVPIDTDSGLRHAYVPVELPFVPGLHLGPELQALLRQAHSNLGRMDGAGAVLPRRDLFIRNYLFKEAALTSQIEGTVTTFEELQNFELAPKPGQSELQEAVNHIRATYIAVDEFKKSRSLDLELILKLHEVLLRSGRGSQHQPRSASDATELRCRH